MWLTEDLEDINPPESGQTTSFLGHVLKIGVATSDLLTDTADSLESENPSAIALFAQLPYQVAKEKFHITAKGSNPRRKVYLTFLPKMFIIDPSGTYKLSNPSAVNSNNEYQAIARITQVTGILNVWGPRTRLLSVYKKHLSQFGLKDDTIGKLEPWMLLPTAKLPELNRKVGTLRAREFEVELARRCRSEFLYAINSTLNSLAHASLCRFPEQNKLLSYFAMIAPGRLACAGTPISVAVGLCEKATGAILDRPDLELVDSLINSPRPPHDRLVSQLTVMHDLLAQGEPRLALTGSVSAIEWFINSSFPSLQRVTKSGHTISKSLDGFLKAKESSFVDHALKARLTDVARLRNSFVHGAIPHRDVMGASNQSKHDEEVEAVREAIYVCLQLYREVNHFKSQDGSAQRGAAADRLNRWRG